MPSRIVSGVFPLSLTGNWIRWNSHLLFLSAPPHRRAGRSRGRRRAVAAGQQDSEGGSVGALCDTGGRRVCCSSDGHGLGARGVPSAVLM